VFQPVLAKHSKSFSLVDAISVGVDRMQRNFEPMRKQVEMWRPTELSTVTAKMIIYQAFIESELEAPKHLARRVHDFYFSATSRVRAENDLEPIQCVHIGFQRSRSHPAVSRYGQAGELPRCLFQAELLRPQGRTETTVKPSPKGGTHDA
jgi:hypothetical protein